jgi:hypothetical protein
LKFEKTGRDSIMQSQRQNPTATGDIFMSLISAGLFLYVGFGLGLVGISGNWPYDTSVAALTWGARVVGFGILLVAALSYFRVPGALTLDFLSALLATALCAAVGAIWLAYADWEGVLLLLFAALNASATRGAWLRWRAPRVTRTPFDSSPSHGEPT